MLLQNVQMHSKCMYNMSYNTNFPCCNLSAWFFDYGHFGDCGVGTVSAFWFSLYALISQCIIPNKNKEQTFSQICTFFFCKLLHITHAHTHTQSYAHKHTKCTHTHTVTCTHAHMDTPSFRHLI